MLKKVHKFCCFSNDSIQNFSLDVLKMQQRCCKSGSKIWGWKCKIVYCRCNVQVGMDAVRRYQMLERKIMEITLDASS
jgi:hypothetical protein